MADGRTQVRLQDILDEIEGIRSVTMGLSFVEFDRSWAAVRATQHALLIISEAVKNLPADLKARRPEIPWGRIQALGNFLRHEYAAIDNDRIWSIVVDHLPALEAAVRTLLGTTSSRPLTRDDVSFPAASGGEAQRRSLR